MAFLAGIVGLVGVEPIRTGSRAAIKRREVVVVGTGGTVIG